MQGEDGRVPAEERAWGGPSLHLKGSQPGSQHPDLRAPPPGHEATGSIHALGVWRVLRRPQGTLRRPLEGGALCSSR